MEKILTIQNLGKSFKGKEIIRDISFDVHKGEIMAILGPNGAGKSTTIRNIMGIMYPDQGSVKFHNHPTGDIPRHKIGYLPEERGLYKNVSVMDLILYFAELKDYPLKKAKERMMNYLEMFHLEGKEKSSVEELSKGMGQKIQFIASVIHEPELLILDEPFSGLDPVSQEVFKKEIKDLASSGTAILLSSHQMNMVEQLCDRLFMIHKGTKVIYGTLNDVKKEYASFKCSIRGMNSLDVLKTIPQVQRIEERGDITTLYLSREVEAKKWLEKLPESLNIEELSLDRVSLHEIFIDIATDRNMMIGGDFHEK